MKKHFLLLSFLILFSICNLALAADCQYCSGGSGWSGGDPDAGEPPSCGMYASSRSLGECVDGTTGTCTENSKATLHYKFWNPEVSLAAEAVCAARHLICFLICNGDQACEYDCLQLYAQCLEDNTICMLDVDEYSSYMDGCV